MKMTFNFWNLDGLENKIKQLNVDTLKKSRKCVKKHTANLQYKAKRIVPVDTGTLKRSILSKLSTNGLTGEVEPHTHYQSYVEYGTSKMSAKPYMRPSFEQTKEEFIRDMRRIFK